MSHKNEFIVLNILKALGAVIALGFAGVQFIKFLHWLF